MIRSACALILLAGFCASTLADADKPMTSLFLVAKAGLVDPNFRNSVVLLTHKEAEPTGVIVNMPTDIPLARVLPEIERLASAQEKLFFGGPVHPDVLTFVFRAPVPPEGAIEVLEGVYLSSSRELLRELLQSDKRVEGLRVFSGYASWGTEQLESEITRGDWHWAQADAKAIFEKKPQSIWLELTRYDPRGNI